MIGRPGQPYAVYLGVEKATLLGLMESWFEDLGLPIVALRGYSSQTLTDDVAEDIAAEVATDVEAENREAVLIYAGDFDPSGDNLRDDFVRRVGRFKKVVQVAITAEQAQKPGTDLPPDPDPAKPGDPRYEGFLARYGSMLKSRLRRWPPSASGIFFS